GLRPRTTSARGADFVLVFVEGRIQRFIRSSFSRLPSTDFDESWGLVAEGVWG
ncbi:MAG: nucleoid occlusion factor SlmA, partial [Gammaproteobacteria bacterium]|nr:nucleoid occlusion factor SlmA [Gammaproteobacteria bacterium]